MSLQQIPLDNAPNQSWKVSVNIDGQPIQLNVTLRYNEIAQYWVMRIVDINGNLLLDSIPLLTGITPALQILNLLNQFQYLGIGSAAVVNISGVSQDSPNNIDLGTDFGLFWGDNAA